MEFQKINLLDAGAILADYIDSLTDVTDDFWEDHILNAESFLIRIHGKNAGIFSIYQSERLTLFYLSEDFRRTAQEVFQEILNRYEVKSAFVATCDPLFLCMCLDFHKSLDLQAYFFKASGISTRTAEFSKSNFRRMDPREFQSVRELTGDFFDNDLEKENISLYGLFDKDTPLGYGLIVPLQLRPEFWCCGMITLEQHRRRGVGRSIQKHLTDICWENQKNPVSGCWYKNTLSKKTIESAGKVACVRLLNVQF